MLLTCKYYLLKAMNLTNKNTKNRSYLLSANVWDQEDKDEISNGDQTQTDIFHRLFYSKLYNLYSDSIIWELRLDQKLNYMAYEHYMIGFIFQLREAVREAQE